MLSPKHLHLSINSTSSTVPKFTWKATNITSKRITIEIKFQDPLSISNEDGVLDQLTIKLLPPALMYIKSLATGVMTEDPLRSVIKNLPKQVIPGAVIEKVEVVTESVADGGIYTNVVNIIVTLVLN